MNLNLNDTIIAPITNLATQAVAVFRLSGDEAFKILKQVVKKIVPHRQGVFYRSLYQNEELIDDVVLTTFIAPRSFTGEDVVEISCHGGILNSERILKLFLTHGARLALKGEFSQRAYLHGKINLVQAEAINDLIHAPNELALKLQAANMHGLHNHFLEEIRTRLLDVIAKIQVAIDYPDYEETESATPEKIAIDLTALNMTLKVLINRSRRAEKAIYGIKTIIIGPPNVGKSSLLNALLNEEKAIVTEIPGTTRDLVEGIINLEGFSLRLVDTAGIRETTDLVEKIGIEKTKKALQEAEWIFFVTTPRDLQVFENTQLLKLIKDKKVFWIVNQSDQFDSHFLEQLRQQNPHFLFTSAKKDNLEELILNLQKNVQHADLTSQQELILTNTRQISLLENLQTKIQTAQTNLKAGFPIDLIIVDLYQTWDLLKALLGEEQNEEIIDHIFRKYCLGK